MFAALLAALSLVAPDSTAGLLPVKLPASSKSPVLREGLPGTGPATPAPPRPRFFGLGLSFQDRGTAQGVPLSRVVPGSPADRAGLTAGTVVAEIDGTSTVGRNEVDCIRMVREAGNAVVLKYYDPATLKLRTRTLEKDWFPVPN
jgi:S1-C subfamily serine protease